MQLARAVKVFPTATRTTVNPSYERSALLATFHIASIMTIKHDSNYREALQNIQTVATLHNVAPRIQLDGYQLLGGT